MVEKRAFSFEGTQPASKSKAARFNAHVLKSYKLQSRKIQRSAWPNNSLQNIHNVS
jgi:hypothetical protein